MTTQNARPRRPSPRQVAETDMASVPVRHVAVVGAGMAGIACARTLVQAGCHVTLIEKSRGFGGRMATRRTEFGGFDHGAQYFTARDSRFARVLLNAQDVVRPWSVSTVRILDELGHVLASAPPPKEPHYVAKPGMSALVGHWAEPLAHPERFGDLNARTLLQHRVVRIERDALDGKKWQLRTDDLSVDGEAGQEVLGGFDQVVLAMPHPQAADLLKASSLAPAFQKRLAEVSVAPCWTLMVAFPNASQPGMKSFGPHWNAARSTHHRISWLAREGSKPGRGSIERWTVHASPEWSTRHLEDSEDRVQAKLLKAFAEVTGIRATPAHAVVHRWRYAQTQTPLGQSHLFDEASGLGLCGDWCLGHRVEDAFVSGLELALAMV